MNMHGIMTPQDDADRQEFSFAARAQTWALAHRMFLLVVVLPTLVVAAYLFLIASNQYESEAHFLVRTSSTPEPVAGSGVSQAISFVTGAGTAQNESMSVADYLTSHDVVATLRRDDRLVERFSRPGVDPLSRLNSASPTPERLLKYYRHQVSISFSTETGITTMRVRAFTPQDSFDIARNLLLLGEGRVNMLNTRSYRDTIAMAQRQLGEAERALENVQVRLTQFRQNRGDIDPEASGKTQIGLVSELTAQLSNARAQLNAMGGIISSSSPQYKAMAARVRAMEGQVAAQSSRLTGGTNAIANDISGYSALQLRQQFLSKQYEAAAANLQKAREQAQKQQLYVVRIVDANMPVKALYPERLRILATVLVALLLIYSIGWLIAAGVREHAA